MSNKREREKRREERLQEETKVDAGERRTRLLQFGAGAVFLVIVAVVVLIVASSVAAAAATPTNLKEVERGRLAGRRRPPEGHGARQAARRRSN